MNTKELLSTAIPLFPKTAKVFGLGFKGLALYTIVSKNESKIIKTVASTSLGLPSGSLVQFATIPALYFGFLLAKDKKKALVSRIKSGMVTTIGSTIALHLEMKQQAEEVQNHANNVQ